MTAFITVYDEHGVDHLINVDHIVRIRHGIGHPPQVHLTNGAITVYGTPHADRGSTFDIVHQDIIDQLGGKA